MKLYEGDRDKRIVWDAEGSSGWKDLLDARDTGRPADISCYHFLKPDCSGRSQSLSYNPK